MEDKQLFEKWRFKVEDNSWDDPSGCWLWLKKVNNVGYGSVNWRLNGRAIWNAHVGSWIAYNEQDVPDGLEIHHTCQTRRCVNPQHLVLVTAQENSQIKDNADTTFCKRGHLRTEDNRYYHNSIDGRVRISCKLCELSRIR